MKDENQSDLASGQVLPIPPQGTMQPEEFHKHLRESHIHATRTLLNVFIAFIITDQARLLVIVLMGDPNLSTVPPLADTINHALTYLGVIVWTYFAWSYLSFLIYPVLLATDDPRRGAFHTPIGDLFYMLLILLISKGMIRETQYAFLGIVLIAIMHKTKAFELWIRLLGEKENRRRLNLFTMYLWPPHPKYVETHLLPLVQKTWGEKDPRTALFIISTKWLYAYRFPMFIIPLGSLMLFFIIIGLLGLLGVPVQLSSVISFLTTHSIGNSDWNLTPLTLLSGITQFIAVLSFGYVVTINDPFRRPLNAAVMNTYRITEPSKDDG